MVNLVLVKQKLNGILFKNSTNKNREKNKSPKKLFHTFYFLLSIDLDFFLIHSILSII
jgi:hypothetical protein